MEVRDTLMSHGPEQGASPAHAVSFLGERGCPSPQSPPPEQAWARRLFPFRTGMLFWELVTQLDPAFISGIELLPQ